MAYHGQGKRGRPFGSTTKPQFKDFVTPDEVKKLVKIAKKQAETKPELLKFVLEHIFGKAPQPVTGAGGGPLKVEISEVIAKKHGLTPSTNGDSEG